MNEKGMDLGSLLRNIVLNTISILQTYLLQMVQVGRVNSVPGQGRNLPHKAESPQLVQNQPFHSTSPRYQLAYPLPSQKICPHSCMKQTCTTSQALMSKSLSPQPINTYTQHSVKQRTQALPQFLFLWIVQLEKQQDILLCFLWGSNQSLCLEGQANNSTQKEVVLQIPKIVLVQIDSRRRDCRYKEHQARDISRGKPTRMWQDILDWVDKLPRTTSAQHCKPYLKHPSSVPPDQENMQTSQSKLHTA